LAVGGDEERAQAREDEDQEGGQATPDPLKNAKASGD
jgi:hypothetical protein